MTKNLRKYSPEFTREAIELALNSSSITQAAKDLGMPEATLHTWVQKAKRTGDYSDPVVDKPVNLSKLIEEHQQLKKRLARLEQEKAILKKAAKKPSILLRLHASSVF